MCGIHILFLFLGYRCVYLVSKHDEQQDRINRNIHILKPIVNSMDDKTLCSERISLMMTGYLLIYIM